MVVFTCTHCGESLKKNQVEKHYSVTRCRNSFPVLTCVDCLKDFKGRDYNGHTSCVTEEERYSAKGFVSKPPSDKGKKKQEEWIHFISKILDSDVDIDRQVKELLKTINNNPGIPQKRGKFLNFCKNTFPFKSSAIYEQTWEFLEKKKKEMQNETSKQPNNETNGESGHGKKRKRIDSNNECSTEFSENCISDASKQTLQHSGKKKQKQDSFRESHDEVGEGDANMGAEYKKKKSKGKRKNSSVYENEKDNNTETKVVGEPVVSEGTKESDACDLLSKKEKKEKRKKEKYEKQLLEIQNEPGHGDCEEHVNNVEVSQKSKKKKEKKKKHQENGALEELETTVKKGSKRKLKQSDIEIVGNDEDMGEQDEEVQDVKSSKFSWEETVVKLLESKGELPLKRVEKKIVNEYINSGVHVDSMEKVIAKFHKKIVKMSRVKVKKDIVKLVS